MSQEVPLLLRFIGGGVSASNCMCVLQVPVYGSCSLHGRDAGSRVQGTVTSSDCAGQYRLSL